jgi:sugar/nucleoside kinase (ribokinase family)
VLFVTAQLDIVDTTGAGDAFTAGFLYKLLQVRDKQEQCQ